MTTIDAQIDTLAPTARRATAAKALHNRRPTLHSDPRGYLDDAAAILDTLDEHDSELELSQAPQPCPQLVTAVRHVLAMAHHGTALAPLLHAVIELERYLPETEQHP